MRLMSTTTSGAATLVFMTLTRLCPPARTRAPSREARRRTASSRVSARAYSTSRSSMAPYSTRPAIALRQQVTVPPERGEDSVYVLVHVVEVECDPYVRVAHGDDDSLGGKLGGERLDVGRAHADERPAPTWIARRRHCRAELVQAGDETRGQSPHVRLDGGRARLLNDRDAREPAVDIWHRRRARVEASRLGRR